MDTEVAGSRGKRRRLWVAGGVGAVLVVGVLAGLVADRSRSGTATGGTATGGTATGRIEFQCNDQTFWFDTNETKTYEEIDNKDQVATFNFLRNYCRLQTPYYTDTGGFVDYLKNAIDIGSKEFWISDEAGMTCEFGFGGNGAKASGFFLDRCKATTMATVRHVLRIGIYYTWGKG